MWIVKLALRRPHVDHRRANFNVSRFRANRRKQREW
jgi:hypothetical protein